MVATYIFHQTCHKAKIQKVILNLNFEEKNKIYHYIREYTGVYRHFYMTHVHILWGRNSTSCTFVGEEIHRRDAYTKEEKTSFMRKPCFVLFYLMLVFSLLYGALSYVQYLCLVALIASCLCVGHAYILMLLCFIDCIFR